MTNREIRAWYQAQVSAISSFNGEWIEQGIDLEERARRAFNLRHNARTQARSMMENPTEVDDLRERDRRLYGNPDGPTFEQLVEHGQQAGLKRDDVYERIITGAATTNREVDKLLGVKPKTEPPL
jgi:hypothetical protein